MKIAIIRRPCYVALCDKTPSILAFFNNDRWFPYCAEHFDAIKDCGEPETWWVVEL
jgi:hypothetical protein